MRDLILRIHLDFIDGIIVARLDCTYGRYWLTYFLGSYCSYDSFLKMAPEFLEGMLHDVEQRPGKYSPCLIVSSFRDKEGIHELSLLLSDRLTFVSVFSLHYVEDEIIK